jgi:hypothetical protein
VGSSLELEQQAGERAVQDNKDKEEVLGIMQRRWLVVGLVLVKELAKSPTLSIPCFPDGQ